MSDIKLHKKFKNLRSNDDQICITDFLDYKVIVIADGVSDCSRGRIAAATICYGIKKYFNRPIENCSGIKKYLNRSKKNQFDIKKEGIEAIKFAVEELDEIQKLFDEHYAPRPVTKDQYFKEQVSQINEIVENKNLEAKLDAKASKSKHKNKKKIEGIDINKNLTETVDECIVNSINDISACDIGIADLKYNNLSTQNSQILLRENEFSLESNSLYAKLIEIFSELLEFNEDEYTNVHDFVNSLWNNIRDHKSIKGTFEFQTTLSLSLLKTVNDYTELYSFNFGDTEIQIVTVDPKNKTIESMISHYRIAQHPLQSCISSKSGENGRFDIAYRRLYKNDILLIGSDGTCFSKTFRDNGNPYAPLQNLIIKCLMENAIDNLPEMWYKKLEERNVLDDDFSFIMAIL